MTAHNCTFSNNQVYNCTPSNTIIRTALSILDYPLSYSSDCEITGNIFKGNKVVRNHPYYCSRNSVKGLKSNYNTIDPRKIYRYEGKDLTLTEFRKLGFETNSLTESFSGN